MTVNLSGKVALVTGSTSGIGLAMAKMFAQNGAHVVLNGLGDEGMIQAAKDEVSAVSSCGVSYNGANMLDAGAIQQMVLDVQTAHGSVDILVNNAGIQHVCPIEDFPPQKWEDILAINLSSAFYSSTAALPGMQSRNYGRIINIASVHGLVGSVEKSAYVAAKHGIIGLTKVTALENAEANITCNAICPGWVRTPLVEKQINALAEKEQLDTEAAAKALLLEKEPSLRFTTPEELAEAALFLCGPGGANMTGTSIAMDGGWSAR
ncbi:3-hydroxybutyrate dehydrogenase [Sneathiella aquimaris]|uniref:3-hydroxybutyrate dehydrogenase n=1 Tax=Sneathiella aquimaris TaxID=2599305 RepID=UPI00146BBE86|nr:3-hydroxybutyrate dehydrogenase [Sneathiella aquimaris]